MKAVQNVISTSDIHYVIMSICQYVNVSICQYVSMIICQYANMSESDFSDQILKMRMFGMSYHHYVTMSVCQYVNKSTGCLKKNWTLFGAIVGLADKLTNIAPKSVQFFLRHPVYVSLSMSICQ